MKKLIIPVAALIMGASLYSCKQDETVEITPVENANQQPETIDGVAETYFEIHADETDNESKLLTVAHDFLSSHGKENNFEGLSPYHIRPIYAYGIEGVAYYEIWFTRDGSNPEGWIMVSATDKDYPLLNFSTGIPYSSNLSYDEGDKVYRFGVSYFVLERGGVKVDEFGEMPSRLRTSTKVFGGSFEGSSQQKSNSTLPDNVPVLGEDFMIVSSYNDLKNNFAESYFTPNREKLAADLYNKMSSTSGNYRVAADDYTYVWLNGQVPFFTQIPPNTGVNTFDCHSGCNNNAWANLYGWWDLNKGKQNLIPTTSTGETSPIYRNTAARQAVTDPVQMYTRAACNTYCGSDGTTGWTRWQDVYKGYTYAGSKGYGTNYGYQWSWPAGWSSNLANVLTEGLANRKEPVLIGANSHLYVARAWAQIPSDTQATWAYCYPGWSENSSQDVWIHWGDFNASVRLSIY